MPPTWCGHRPPVQFNEIKQENYKLADEKKSKMIAHEHKKWKLFQFVFETTDYVKTFSQPFTHHYNTE